MNILVCYDGSNVARDALKLAQKHAETYGAKLLIAKAIPQDRDLQYSDIQEAEDDLGKDVRKILGEGDIAYDTQLLVTNLTAGEELVDFARRYNVDEIVLGVKRRSKVGKLIFGSTAQYVILNAPCPVVSIR
jgi:nucleotide-binding universal stress UspA family protein